ncbi:MAG: MFS transporter [Chloroflexota bacterium]|nr:MFS transporter [Chloroflexota bacterium]
MRWLNADGRVLLLTRALRSCGYGYLAVVLALYLNQIGLDSLQIGALLTAALAGSAAMNVFWSLRADQFGRRRTMVIMGLLMCAGGLLFALTDNVWLLLLAAFSGTISATSSEVGAFVTVEQAILPQTAPAEQRTWLFSVYDLLGSFAGAAGALLSGTPAWWTSLGVSGADAYRPLFVLYAAIGLANAWLFWRLSDRVELARVEGERRFLGVHRSRGIVARLALLFGLDAFAGALVVQSLLAYWFYVRWGLAPAELAVLFFWVNLVSGLSFLATPLLAQRFGLLNTMVFSHLPSNVLLMLVPLAPSPEGAIALLLLRQTLSQMDVPTRKSYMMAVVEPDERTATAGLTNTARTVAAACAPVLTGAAFSVAALGLPFIVGGGLKILYDSLIWLTFHDLRPPEEQARRAGGHDRCTYPRAG